MLLDSPQWATDFADTHSSEQRAAVDLGWPTGLQEELSHPVAVLLNEEAATIRNADEEGFRCFAEEAAFNRYVSTEVLAEAAHA